MTVGARELDGSGDVVAAYREAALQSRTPDRRTDADFGGDELLAADGPRPVTARLAEALREDGPTGLQRRARRVRAFVRDEGITYGTGNAAKPLRPWALDPVPLVLGAAEWDALERGLSQRAELLNGVLTDLYGPQDLLRRGLIPAEVVLGHDGFLPAVVGLRHPGPRQLVLVATDLARDAEGAWRLLSDRTQAPSGAAYAMANRRIVSRVLPGLHRATDLARLRWFFDRTRSALQSLAPRAANPRVVVLSPGPLSETGYDQALTATLLGFPLVEGEDLTVRDGAVWLRTTGRLERVDVILRRVDGDWSDSLDLRPDSELGVPGLVEAARAGSVAVANPLGASVLENAALMPFMAGLCRELLGEDLILRPPQTWWCGEPAQRSHVLAHLDSLMIKHGPRGSGQSSWYGGELTSAQRAALAARIEAQPWQWSGQEVLPLSTAPVVARGGLEPRRVVLRTFGVAHGSAYSFMPGGLARVGTKEQVSVITNAAGAPSKDVWVLAARDAERRAPLAPVGPVSILAADGRADLAGATAEHSRGLGGALTPRVAEDLFWLGRYLERTEGTSRLLRVAADLDEDHGMRPDTPGAQTLEVMLVALGDVTAVPRPPAEGAERARELAAEANRGYLRRLLLDERLPGTVAHAAQHAVRAAQSTREQMSQDLWAVLSRLEVALGLSETSEEPLEPTVQAVLESVIAATLAAAGIQQESMVRGPEWSFLDAGRRLERAEQTVRLLRHTVAVPRAPIIDAQVTEAVLLVGESAIANRRRNAAGVGPAAAYLSVVDLLLLDGTNPRSVRHCLDLLAADVAQFTDLAPGDQPRLAALIARTETVDLATIDLDDRSGLVTLLDEIDQELRLVCDALTGTYFVKRAPQQVLPVQREFAGDEGQDSGRLHTRRTYEVRHATTYRYDDEVTDSYSRGLLRPRDTATQRVLEHSVEVSPTADLLREHRDFFGNHSHYVEVRTPHTELSVTKRSVVEVHWPPVDVDALNALTVAAAAQHLARAADPVERTLYLLPSQLVEIGPEVAAYADTILPADRPLGDALADLYARIYADFAYRKGSTTVRSTLREILAARAGVCQDFAHLAAGCLRSVGLPARYVSGYIETSPPAGTPKLAGSDASHAWVGTMVPGPGAGPDEDGAPAWVDLDPTNNHFADSRYIVTGWGRDYRDVAPLRGVIFTEATSSTLDVAVDVTRLP